MLSACYYTRGISRGISCGSVKNAQSPRKQQQQQHPSTSITARGNIDNEIWSSLFSESPVGVPTDPYSVFGSILLCLTFIHTHILKVEFAGHIPIHNTQPETGLLIFVLLDTEVAKHTTTIPQQHSLTYW